MELQEPVPAMLELDLEEPEASPSLANNRVDVETVEDAHFRPVSPSIECMEAVSPSGPATASPCSTCPPTVCRNDKVNAKADLPAPDRGIFSTAHENSTTPGRGISSPAHENSQALEGPSLKGNHTRSLYDCNGELVDSIKVGEGSAWQVKLPDCKPKKSQNWISEEELRETAGAIDEIVEMDEEAAALKNGQNSVVGSLINIRAARGSQSNICWKRPNRKPKCNFDIWETVYSY